MLGLDAEATTSYNLGTSSFGEHRASNRVRISTGSEGQWIDKSDRWHNTACKCKGETEYEVVGCRTQDDDVQKAQVVPVGSISQSERCRGDYIRGSRYRRERRRIPLVAPKRPGLLVFLASLDR